MQTKYSGIGGLVAFAALFLSGTALAAVPENGVVETQTDAVDQLIVRYKTDPTDAQLKSRMNVAQRAGLARGVTMAHKRRGALGMHVLKLGKPMRVADAAQLAKELAASDPNIEYAEPDYIAYPTALVPNDPHYLSRQGNLQVGPASINMPYAWDVATGSGVVVAVVDTGYRPHADLVANLLPGYDFISSSSRARDGNGRDASALDEGDWYLGGECSGTNSQASTWHGTHVAGVIAASTNNNMGVAGVAFNARIVPVRVLGKCGGVSSDIADGIVWASGGSVPGVPANPNPARVINLSLGSNDAGACGSTYQNAVNSARSRNVVVVAAAGNGNNNANYQPGNCSGVITVAATTLQGGRASYSSYGPLVELAAPGGEWGASIFSLKNSGASTPVSDSYAEMPGTSAATPQVSGVAALLLQINPALTPDQVSLLLQQSTSPFPLYCGGCGTGIVNAVNAVNLALPPPPSPIRIGDLYVQNANANGVANAIYWLKSNGELHVSNDSGPGTFYYDDWLSPKTGMSGYEARAVNSTCQGASGTWFSLASGAMWNISTPNANPDQYVECSFTLMIRAANNPNVILKTAYINLAAWTGF